MTPAHPRVVRYMLPHAVIKIIVLQPCMEIQNEVEDKYVKYATLNPNKVTSVRFQV